MLAKTKEKDVIDQLLNQIDFHGMTAEELAKVFNVDLPALTETVLKEVSEDEYYSYARALREIQEG